MLLRNLYSSFESNSADGRFPRFELDIATSMFLSPQPEYYPSRFLFIFRGSKVPGPWEAIGPDCGSRNGDRSGAKECR